MSVKQENELVTSSHKRAGKRSWKKLIRGRNPAQTQNTTTSLDSHKGTQWTGASEAHFGTSSDTSSQDHKTSRVAGNPFKTIYRWFRANTFRPVWLPNWLRYPISGYVAAVLLQVVAVMATLVLAQIFPTFAYPAALEFLAIILVTVTWGVGPSLVATFVGLALLNYFVLPPHFRWSFAKAEDVVEAILFLTIGLAISIVATRIEHARRNAEKLATSLAAERARLDAVIETVPDMVSIHDATGRIVRVNRAAREKAGERGGEALADTQEVYELRTVTGEPMPDEALPVARALHGEIVSDVEMRGRDDAGNELYMLVSAAPMRDLQGKVEGVVAITHDISALRQTEFAAAIRARELEATFETMADAVFVFGSEGQVVRMNAAARELFGLDAGIDLSQTLHEHGYKTVVLDEHDQPIPEEEWPLFRVVRGEVLTSANALDMRVRTSMGRIVELSVSGAPLLNHEGLIIGAVCICRDVTERRILERRTNDALVEARANEIVLRAANLQMEEFLGMISHELKTPLTSIKGNIQLATRQLKNSIQTFEKMVQFQESAEQQSRRLNRMVDDLLDVSRTRAGHLELRPAPCDLATIVQESVEEQRRIWPGRAITLDVPEEMNIPILADADRIRQVITNYLTNALKYSDDDHPVQVTLRLEGEEARVAVRDEGPGLSAEDQQRVWERFQRVPGVEVHGTPHSSTAGLGLGLYISKTIIEGHSGRVGVESVLGEGSTFWFTLPLAKQEEG